MTTSQRSGRFYWLITWAYLGVMPVMAGGPYHPPDPIPRTDSTFESSVPVDTVHAPSRALAAVFALTLGPFGGHRLYLGTRPKVPLVYGLTFGGFGVLAVVDMAHILFTRDLSAYQGNDRVFMWAKPRTDAPIRP